ncbi:MAG: thioesterase family protein [Anaerolineae bacterium]
MPPTGFISNTPIRVRYAETDQMGIAHHTAYIVWFEAGRSDWMRQQGYSYADFEKAGYLLPLSEVGARFVLPALYDEEVIVQTWISELRSRKLQFSYQVVRPPESTLLVTGFSTHIVTDKAGRVTTFPAEVRQFLEKGVGGQ